MKKVVWRARNTFLERFLRQKKYIETKRFMFRVLWTWAKMPLSQTWQFWNNRPRSMGLLTLPLLRENQTWYANDILTKVVILMFLHIGTRTILNHNLVMILYLWPSRGPGTFTNGYQHATETSYQNHPGRCLLWKLGKIQEKSSLWICPICRMNWLLVKPHMYHHPLYVQNSKPSLTVLAYFDSMMKIHCQLSTLTPTTLWTKRVSLPPATVIPLPNPWKPLQLAAIHFIHTQMKLHCC